MADNEGQFRSKNPRGNGVMSVVIALALAVVAAALLVFWTVTGDVAFVAPAVALLALAVLGAIIAVLAFRVAAYPESKASLARPLQVVTILVFVVGVVGAVVTLVVAVMTGSFASVGLAIAVGVVCFAVALQGAMVYGTARHQA